MPYKCVFGFDSEVMYNVLRILSQGSPGQSGSPHSLKGMAQDQRQGELRRLFQGPGSRERGQNKGRSRAALEESNYKRDVEESNYKRDVLKVGYPGGILWEEVEDTRPDSIKLVRIVPCPGQGPLRPSSGSVGAMRSFPVSIIQNVA